MPSGTVARNDRWKVLAICVFLAAIVWAVFGQTRGYEFVNYDDGVYVYDNGHVCERLSWEGVAWAFNHSVNSNWHPLTLLSYMLDYQFYGLRAGGYHLTNVGLHGAAAILLFLVLRQMTAGLWRSAFVATLFAIHPLRVESVAWIAERKDVLSGVLFMLTIAAYVYYARRAWSPVRYGLAVPLFALGLMCKPMLVTLPCVLLLLDYWPLNRWGGWRAAKRLILEKLPLFGLAAASCAVTLFVQTKAIFLARTKAIGSFDQVSLPLRAGNALTSCATYLGQMFWPSDLAVFYPFPAAGRPLGEMILAVVFLFSISACFFVLRKTRPYLLVGWLWYLIMLMPVIGVLQVGLQAHADRYTYLPQIGLYLTLTWAVGDWSARWRNRPLVLGGMMAAVVGALMACARSQTAYWRDSETLWTHTLECTSDNYVACNNLGLVLFQKGRADEATVQFQQALQFNPNYEPALDNLGDLLIQTGKVDEAILLYQKALQIDPNNEASRNNLGSALLRKGRIDEAIDQFKKAVQINPDNAFTRNNLGNALMQKGRTGEAIDQFKKAVQIKPDDAETCYNIGTLSLQSGNLDEAILYYQQTLRIKPDFAEARNNLGNALMQKGRFDEAIGQFEKAVQIKPDYAYAQNNLAWALSTAPQASLRNANQAVAHAQQANQLTGGENPFILRTLAAAYAEAGRYGDAIECAQKAMGLARAAGQTDLMKQINDELKLFAAGLPFRQDSQ
jgi:tetratricopeptide (TPR) repeat protein